MPNEDELFIKAIEIESLDQRVAFLKSACGDDGALYGRVVSLIDCHVQSRGLLDSAPPGLQVTATHASLEKVGENVGPYKLLQQIGEGGMGVVFMAEQSSPLHRKVALKIIKPSMDTQQVIARFEAERQALAMMDHPNIAKVYEAGATERGRPYFAMELVKGVPIIEFCDKNQMPAQDRLRLFVNVCHAIQHAHHKGIIHRDIKPSNVMVTLHDGIPIVKVIDFGVAKATIQRLTERTLFTAYGQMVGTPAYMSPEQAEMSGLDIDTRSDIYSLGVLLYELLTGTTPLESKQLKQALYGEMQRLICEQEAPRPSVRLSSLGELASIAASNRGSDSKQLIRLVSGDLDCIVMKSLEKDRIRRYDCPANLAADINRYLRGDAIQARPTSSVYRFKKFVQRNRGGVAAGIAIAAALFIGLIATTWQAVLARQAAQRERATAIAMEAERNHARQAQNDAMAAEADAQSFSAFLVNDVLAVARPVGTHGGLGVDVTIRQALELAESRMTNTFAGRPGAEVTARHAIGITFLEGGQYEAAERNLRRAAELSETLYGAKAAQTRAVQHDLGNLLLLTNRVVEAVPQLQQAVQKVSSNSEVSSTEIRASTDLAWALSLCDRVDESIELQERTLSLARLHLVEDDPNRLYAISRMAEIYNLHGQEQQALELYEEVVKRLEVLGANHITTLSTLFGLRRIRFDEANIELREELLERVASGYRRQLGASHPQLAYVLVELGLCQRGRGQFALAEATCREALKALEGTSPQSTIRCEARFLLGVVLVEQQRFSEAEGLVSDAYEGIKAASTPEVERRELETTTLKWLALIRGNLGRRDEASRLLQIAMEASPMDEEVHRLYGEQFARQGRWQEASEGYVRAYELKPDNHGMILNAAVSAIAAGDRAAYEHICNTALAQFSNTDDPIAADRTAKACMLVPRTADEATQQLRIAEVAVTQGQTHEWLKYFQLARGMAAYRSDDWAGTLEWCGKSRQQAGQYFPLTALNELFEAMAHHRLGNSDEARAKLSIATKLLSDYDLSATNDRGVDWHDWLMCRVISREAEELLGTR